MKKKLSLLILSCFLLSTPCFAFDRHHHRHKMPHPPKYHIVKKPPIQHNHIYYYDGYSDSTTENWAIITESVSNIVDTLFN